VQVESCRLLRKAPNWPARANRAACCALQGRSGPRVHDPQRPDSLVRPGPCRVRQPHRRRCDSWSRAPDRGSMTRRGTKALSRPRLARHVKPNMPLRQSRAQNVSSLGDIKPGWQKPLFSPILICTTMRESLLTLRKFLVNLQKWTSDFGFRLSFGLRPSGFGFPARPGRVYRCPSVVYLNCNRQKVGLQTFCHRRCSRIRWRNGFGNISRFSGNQRRK
jgi:hypothetical protein